MHLQAYAKINLFLRVVGRRPDGFHDLETVFQAVSLADDVLIEPSDAPWAPDPPRLTCDDATIPTDGTNLVWRAAVALAERIGGAPGGVQISLQKRIPAGGGLGGGSSDAAAVLVGLRELWAPGLATEVLAGVAAQIGSDVPFFLMGGTALGTGRGEVLQPLPGAPALDLVLVTPAFGVNTGWAFGARVEAGAAALSLAAFQQAVQQGTPAAIAAALRNDLEAGVTARYPEIGAIRQELLEAGALGARMTGSGSTVFGIARDAGDAQRLAAVVARSGRRVAAVRSLLRHPSPNTRANSSAVTGLTR